MKQAHTLTPRERKAGVTAMRVCMNLQPNEHVLIVADPTTQKEATILFLAAKTITTSVQMVTFAGIAENGQEPPNAIARKMQEADVAFLVTQKSLTHTKASIAASAKNTRIASMPGVTVDMMVRLLSADYATMHALSQNIATHLTNGTTAVLTSAAGTTMSMRIHARTGIADTGLIHTPGELGNLPAGEAFIAPVEGTAQGTLVIDGALANIKLDEPIFLTIEKGKIQKMKGGKAANTFEKILEKFDPIAYCVCELGVGTNPHARLTSNMLEAEKVYGTCHIAFGRNTSFGGTLDVGLHIDGLVTKPTLSIDNKEIIRAGIFL